MLYRSPAAAISLWPDLDGLIRETYAEAFNTMMDVLIAISAVAVVASLAAVELHPPPIHRNLSDDSKLDDQSWHAIATFASTR